MTLAQWLTVEYDQLSPQEQTQYIANLEKLAATDVSAFSPEDIAFVQENADALRQRLQRDLTTLRNDYNNYLEELRANTSGKAA